MPFFKVAGPNEAIFVSGSFQREPKVVVGGRCFVWPVIQKSQKLSLELLTLEVNSPKVYTSLGVPVEVTAVAQIKVNTESKDTIRQAAQQFIGKSQNEVMDMFLKTVEGHQRAILGGMTVEEIYKDRNKFAELVKDTASPDLKKMGMVIVSFIVKTIEDDVGYLKSLGMGRISEVKKDARIAVAYADRDTEKRLATAKQTLSNAKFIAEASIAEAARNYGMKKAVYDGEVRTSQAIADKAYELQQAKTKQRIKEEEIKIKIEEKKKIIQVEEQELIRKEKELTAMVKIPAEAERYQIETFAEAQKFSKTEQATAQAEATKLVGIAEADIYKKKGEAEAEAMKKKAAALQLYGKAAIFENILQMLPSLATALAKPLEKTERIILLTQGAPTNGPQKLTNDLTSLLTSLPPSLEAVAGYDVAGLLGKLPGVSPSTSTKR